MATVDELDAKIWTNGSLCPKEAISEGSKILTNLFHPLTNINFEPIETENNSNEERINQVLIEELKLSVRAYNCLKREGIDSVEKLLEYTEDELLDIRNFGQKSIQEVKDKVRELGLSFKQNSNQEN